MSKIFSNLAKKADIRTALQAATIVLPDGNGCPPEPRNDVYQNVIKQAENFKKNIRTCDPPATVDGR